MTPTAIPLPNLTATEQAARRLAPHLRVGDFLALQGPLGAGKTTFARALLQTLGIIEDVPSPTFTLVQIYETPQFQIYHFDLYRLVNETELDELGWDDALADGLVIAEWPERIERRLPKDRLVLHFAFDAKGNRSLGFAAHGGWIKRMENLS
jgi:tRNA threonylcarbamoyladenosine biosynthesis protein TsaE